MTMTASGSSGFTFPDGSTQATAGFVPFRNRIINGDMRIDQRNAGASVTLNGTAQFPVDRFMCAKDTSSAVATGQQSTTAPAGFTNSLLWTTATGASPAAGDENLIWHKIEGFNVADFGWGTANAQPVTLSIQVRSSLTGTFGVTFRNSANNRSYVASFTINSANTFETKSITIAGDTSGTWLTNNGTGLFITFDMGAGTSKSGAAGSWSSNGYVGLTGGVKMVANTGATFYITGVQLEKGSTATSFDYRPYGTELALCQRYFETSVDIGEVPGATGSSRMIGNTGLNGINTTGEINSTIVFKVTKRSNATISVWDVANGSGVVTRTASGTANYNGSTFSGVAINSNSACSIYSASGSSAGCIRFNFTANSEL